MRDKEGGLALDMESDRVDAGGRNRLFLDESPELDDRNSCLTHLIDPDDPPEQVIHITYHQTPDAIIDAWRQHANGHVPAELGIIPVDEVMRSVAASQPTPNGPTAPGMEPTTESVEWPCFDPVAEPDDILAIGGKLKRLLDEFSDASEPPVICFDSITGALDHMSVETMFRFLHLVTHHLEMAGCEAHFHLNPDAVADSTVSTYAVLFDDVVWSSGEAEQSFEPVSVSTTRSSEGSMTDEFSTGTAPSSGLTDRLLSIEPWLWLLAIATFGVGDIFTSVIGLQYGLAVESSPVAALVLNAQGLGFIYIVKLVMFGLFFILWRVTPRPHRVGVPLGLGTLGVIVTAWNLWILSYSIV